MLNRLFGKGTIVLKRLLGEGCETPRIDNSNLLNVNSNTVYIYWRSEAGGFYVSGGLASFLFIFDHM